jgi:hypothetical protein
MRELPLTATDDDLRALVVEWSEHIAAGRHGEALAMFPCSKDSFDIEWTAESFASWIANYGGDESFDDHCHRITSIHALTAPEEFVKKAIQVDRECLHGLDPKRYLGMIHYDDVPLDGKPSHLTARFHIMRVADNRLTLEFLDLHVM